MKKNYLLIGILVPLAFTACSIIKPSTNKNTTGQYGGNPKFLFFSDIHLNTASDSTAYGLDTGMGLWTIFLAKVDSILGSGNAPEFAVYTGDLPAHYSCSEGCYLPPNERQNHNKDLATILTGLRDLFTKHHIPFFYVPGNNDALAGDYYSFADENQLTPLSLVSESVNPYPALNINLSGNIAPCMVSNTHPNMGYYSAKPVEGLRIIGLNTVIYSKKFLTVDSTNQTDDGNEEMNWLAAELNDAEVKGDKVYIAMHIPPGTDAYKHNKTPDKSSMWVRLPNQPVSWENRFLALVSHHQTAIAGIFYGHTHMDELRRLYDSTGRHITAVAISSPGVTPQHNNNPGFKLVEYDKQSKAVLDFTTYYTHPTATTWGNNSYSFNRVFSFPAGNSLYNNVCSASLTYIDRCMNRIYTVMNGVVNYDINSGIEVKYGQ